MPASPQVGYQFTSGTDGRVTNLTTGEILAGLSDWDISGDVAEIELAHFESGANPDLIVEPDWIPGLGTTTVDLTGLYNIDQAGTGTEIGNSQLRKGVTQLFGLWISKHNNFGYQNVLGFIKSFKRGQKINNQAYVFTASIRVRGVMPFPGPVS